MVHGDTLANIGSQESLWLSNMEQAIHLVSRGGAGLVGPLVELCCLIEWGEAKAHQD